MTENEWTRKMSDELKPLLQNCGLCVDTLKKVPYLQEIVGYSENWKPEYMEPSCFETDLVVYEQVEGKNILRIVVEAKLGNVSTHDAITYSYKAEKHKNITPYLRYGIMIGDRKQYPLPGRLFRHGTNFDFMISFAGTDPDKNEWTTFTDMLLKEVEYSRTMEEMLHDSRSKARKRYYMLQKQLILKEAD